MKFLTYLIHIVFILSCYFKLFDLWCLLTPLIFIYLNNYYLLEIKVLAKTRTRGEKMNEDLGKKIKEIEEKMPFVKDLVDVKHYSKLGHKEVTDVSYVETSNYQVVAAKVASSMPMNRGGIEHEGYISLAWMEKGSDKIYGNLKTDTIKTRDGYDGSGEKDIPKLMNSNGIELSLHPEKEDFIIVDWANDNGAGEHFSEKVNVSWGSGKEIVYTRNVVNLEKRVLEPFYQK